ncbi:hypothetical protein F4824DRAFT_161387 [Ustulina deusta]|nr:hypothetical protein F4823DRAFT_25156 [Ustulina deusta]KAI3335281.1 hypothetical protein F4824DRAFT_161387 [Ustulina deusta]
MQFTLRSSALLLAAALLSCVEAGTGASVNACVYYPTDPPPGESFVVKFKAGASSDHCMNRRGDDAEVLVSRKGLTCASLGYVELKNSSWPPGNFCASDKSWWATSYSIVATGESGATNTRWVQGGEIHLKDASPGTSVCSYAALCSATQQSWDGTGELWIIYRPGFRPGANDL